MNRFVTKNCDKNINKLKNIFFNFKIKFKWFKKLYLKIKKHFGLNTKTSSLSSDSQSANAETIDWEKVRKLMWRVEKITTLKKLEEELKEKNKRIVLLNEQNNILLEDVIRIKKRINEINKLSK